MSTVSLKLPPASRETGIGGSEIAAIMGLSPNRTKVDVYCEKRGLVPPFQPDERMRMGTLLQPVVCQIYEEDTGEKVTWFDKTVRHRKEPIVIGSPDGLLPRKRGFEAKTAGLDQAWRWGNDGDEIPEEYIIQSQWYMLLTGYQEWVVQALIGGSIARRFTLQADADLQAELLDEGRKFWRDHMEPGKMPTLDHSRSAKAYLARQFPKDVEPIRDATPEEIELLHAIRRRKEEIKYLNNELEAESNQLREKIGNARGIVGGNHKALWSFVGEGVVQAYTRAPYRRLSVSLLKGVDSDD